MSSSRPFQSSCVSGLVLMKLYKEATSWQGSPKRQKDPSVAAWYCSRWHHLWHMRRAAEGLFHRAIHLALLEHPTASFKVQWRQEEVSNSNTSSFIHIPRLNFYPDHKKLSTSSASWGEAALIPSLHTQVIPAETQGHGKSECLFTSCSCQTGEDHRV